MSLIGKSKKVSVTFNMAIAVHKTHKDIKEMVYSALQARPKVPRDAGVNITSIQINGIETAKKKKQAAQ